MAKRFLTPINLPSRTTDPATASDGDFYFNTSLNTIRVYYGSAWNAISSDSIIVSDTPPVGSEEGQLWYESDSGDLFIRYDSAWVQTGGSGGSSGGTSISVSETEPVATSIGEGWFKSSTSELFIWDGTYWVEATSLINGIPDQSGSSGKFLTTDGSIASWETVEAGGATASYQASEPLSPAVGDIWVDSDEEFLTLNSNSFMQKVGGTFTGSVVFSDTASGITPTLSTHFATKDYVDNSIPEPTPPVESGLNPFLLGGM